MSKTTAATGLILHKNFSLIRESCFVRFAPASVVLAALLVLTASVHADQQRAAYRGTHWGDLLAPSTLSSAGRDAFIEDRSPEIHGAFNATGCRECHNVPTPGGSDFFHPFFVIKQARNGRAATVQRYEVRGGHLVFPPRPPKGPYYLRRPPPLYGVGLLEAVPDAEIVRIRDVEANEKPGHRGRIARLPDGSIGRFGWRADVATLPVFVVNAFSTEIGLTRTVHSTDVVAITAFLRDLAAPPRAEGRSSTSGGAIFGSIGCADCHRPSLRVGTVSAAPYLSGAVIHPYTDLLLHDMGPQNAELPEGAAREREFRTAPLWGTRLTGPRYLHNGSALSLVAAIERHSGQAADSARAFAALSAADRAALLRFVRSL